MQLGRTAWAASLLVVACAAEADGRVHRDAQAIESYVEAVVAGDVEEAMELRCPDNRIDSSKHEQFEDEARRLTEALGPIGVGRIELSDPDPAVVRSMARLDPTEWRYWLTVDDEEVDEPLVAVVADERDEREICTLTTVHYGRMVEALGDDLEVRIQPAADSLAELLPDSVDGDYHQITDEVFDPEPSSFDAANDGWTRQWQEDDGFGGITVSAVRFPYDESALDAARSDMQGAKLAAVEIFSVPGVDGASGIRLLASSWLGIQPPTEGPYVDSVTMVAGDTYLYAAVCCLDADSDHARVISLVQEIAQLAAG